MISTKVVNLYGGPGIGKSTTAAHLFVLLKNDGITCELVTEYAKDKVWEESFKMLENQVYIFGKQYHRLARLLGKVPVIITDSPLLLSCYYGRDTGKAFIALVEECYYKMNNLDILLHRTKPYSTIGRMETEEQSKEIDFKIENILKDMRISYLDCPTNTNQVQDIYSLVKNSL